MRFSKSELDKIFGVNVMTKIKKFISSFPHYTRNEALILILIASAFLSVFLQAALMILLPVYMLATKQLKLALPKKKYGYLFLVFALVACLSTFLYAKDVWCGEFYLRALYLKVLSLLIILLAFDLYFFINIMTKKAFYAALKLCAALSITSFLVALVQKISGIYASADRPGRYASVFMNENYYGTVIEFVVLIATFYFVEKKSLQNRLYYAGVIVFNILGLWFCECRTAYIAVAASVLFYLFMHRRKFLWVIIFIAVVAAIAVIKNPSLLPRFDTSFEYLSYRFGIWKSALKCFADYPLIGRGYYAYSAIWAKYSDAQFYAIHSHNLYIECFLNFGIVGTFSLGGFCFYTLRDFFRAGKKAGKKNEIALCSAALCAILLHGLADTTLFWPQTGIFAALLLTCPQIVQEKAEEVP